MIIRKILKQELEAVIEVHKNSFKDFFLTNLGTDFLLVYYDSIRKDKNAILVGIYEDGILSGFCAACFISKGFNTNLIKKNIFQFLMVCIKLLLISPTSLVRLIKNLSKSNPNIEDKAEYAELLSIGVSKDKQGKGIGKKLLKQLEIELNLKGCLNLSLTTDFNNNDNVIDFYRKMGYEIYYEFIAYPNRKMYRMIKKLN